MRPEFEARRGQAEALARFRTLFEGVSIGILRLGRDGRAVEANPALEQMLGYSAAEFGEMILRDSIHPEDLQESAMLANPKRATAVLEELSALRVRLALDDFGTGSSSLAHLRNLPIDEIEIDRSFVTEMARESADLAIVRCMVDLGLDLGLDVVAEGVETGEVLAQLRGLGCTSAQGHHFSPAVPPEQLRSWLLKRRAQADPASMKAA